MSDKYKIEYNGIKIIRPRFIKEKDSGRCIIAFHTTTITEKKAQAICDLLNSWSEDE